MQNRLEYILLLFISFIANLFGFSRAKYPAGFFAWLVYRVVGLRKKVVIKNLKIAFPELTVKEIDKLAFDNYKCLLMTLCELMCLPKLTAQDILDVVSFRNFEAAMKANNGGKQGTIFLTAHYGNWELGAVAAGVKSETSIAVLYKPQRNKYVSDWINVRRRMLGNESVPLGTAVRDIIKAIKAGKFVGLVGDQRGSKDSPRVKFFGRDTAMYTGTAAIALKMKAPIVMVLLIRRPEGGYLFTVEDIDYSGFEGTDEEKIAQINQVYMNKLEAAIREYPDHWLWMHNIWKY